MSCRLQVLIPTELEARLRKAAQRSQVSKSEYVRRALEESLLSQGKDQQKADPLSRLASLDAPTAPIDQMLTEIETGVEFPAFED